MAKDSGDGWVTVASRRPKRPGQGWFDLVRESEVVETAVQGQSVCRAIGAQDPVSRATLTISQNRFASLEVEELSFPFFKLPGELRDKVYSYLSLDVCNILCQRDLRPSDTGYSQPTYNSRLAAQNRFLGYALASRQLYREFEHLDIRTSAFSVRASDSLHGPKASPEDTAQSRRLFASLRRYTIRAKLVGALQQDDYPEYSVTITFGKEYRGGYRVSMMHLRADTTRTAMGLTKAQYMEMCGRVLCAVREAVVEKRAMDGRHGFTLEGVESIMHALYFC